MIKVVGKRIFEKYYTYDTHSWYTYATESGKSKYETLKLNKNTKGTVVSIDVRYDFYLTEYHCFGGTSHVVFDNKLDITNSIITSFIPDYVLHNLQSNIIKDSLVLSFGRKLFKKPGIKGISTTLKYDYLLNKYVWEVKNITSEYKDWKGKNAGTMEYLEFDAFTGEKLEYYPDALFGPVY